MEGQAFDDALLHEGEHHEEGAIDAVLQVAEEQHEEAVLVGYHGGVAQQDDDDHHGVEGQGQELNAAAGDNHVGGELLNLELGEDLDAANLGGINAVLEVGEQQQEVAAHHLVQQVEGGLVDLAEVDDANQGGHGDDEEVLPFGAGLLQANHGGGALMQNNQHEVMAGFADQEIVHEEEGEGGLVVEEGQQLEHLAEVRDALVQGGEDEILALGDGLIVLPNQEVAVNHIIGMNQLGGIFADAQEDDDGEVVEPHANEVNPGGGGGALMHNIEPIFHDMFVLPAEGGADPDVFVDALDVMDVPVDIEQVALLQAVPAEGHMMEGDAAQDDHDVLADEIPVDVVHAIAGQPALQEGVIVQPVAGEDGDGDQQQQLPDAVDNVALDDLDVFAFGNRPQPRGPAVCCCECGPGLVITLFYIAAFVLTVFGPWSEAPHGVVTTTSTHSTALVPVYPQHGHATQPDPGVCHVGEKPVETGILTSSYQSTALMVPVQDTLPPFVMEPQRVCHDWEKPDGEAAALQCFTKLVRSAISKCRLTDGQFSDDAAVPPA